MTDVRRIQSCPTALRHDSRAFLCGSIPVSPLMSEGMSLPPALNMRAF
jgi:hypothetical protein